MRSSRYNPLKCCTTASQAPHKRVMEIHRSPHLARLDSAPPPIQPAPAPLLYGTKSTFDRQQKFTKTGSGGRADATRTQVARSACVTHLERALVASDAALELELDEVSFKFQFVSELASQAGHKFIVIGAWQAARDRPTG